jgi:hypothetical protein
MQVHPAKNWFCIFKEYLTITLPLLSFPFYCIFIYPSTIHGNSGRTKERLKEENYSLMVRDAGFWFKQHIHSDIL